MQVITYHLLKQFSEIYDGDPWLDECFAKKMTLVNEETAFLQPHGLHSVAEIISHLVEWRKELFNRLEGIPRKMNVNSPENWISNEALQSAGWAKLAAEFQHTQEKIYQILEVKDDYFLAEPYVDENNEYLLKGLLHHDIYHLGQIGLIIKLNQTFLDA